MCVGTCFLYFFLVIFPGTVPEDPEGRDGGPGGSLRVRQVDGDPTDPAFLRRRRRTRLLLRTGHQEHQPQEAQGADRGGGTGARPLWHNHCRQHPAGRLNSVGMGHQKTGTGFLFCVNLCRYGTTDKLGICKYLFSNVP